MADTKQMKASRVIHAPAERIFALLADPRRHAEMDGSGTVRGGDNPPITTAGQQFVMDMFRDDVGGYRSISTVVAFEPPTRIAWAPALDTSFPCSTVDRLAGITTGGHTYTYHLREVGDGTEVTEVYDWSTVHDPAFEMFCPFVSQDDLVNTLANLARLVEQAHATPPLQQV
jgi:uncharacterized protein YndB with AHSA1/START domain